MQVNRRVDRYVSAGAAGDDGSCKDPGLPGPRT